MFEGRVTRNGSKGQLARVALVGLLGASVHCEGAPERVPTPSAADTGEAADEAPAAPERAEAPSADMATGDTEGGDMSSADAAFEPSAPSGSGAFGFQQDVYPILVTHCGECHSENGPYHDAASPDLAIAYADAVEFAERLLARIRQGNMPPACVFEDAACVPPEAILVLERWFDAGMPE